MRRTLWLSVTTSVALSPTVTSDGYINVLPSASRRVPATPFRQGGGHPGFGLPSDPSRPPRRSLQGCVPHPRSDEARAYCSVRDKDCACYPRPLPGCAVAPPLCSICVAGLRSRCGHVPSLGESAFSTAPCYAYHLQLRHKPVSPRTSRACRIARTRWLPVSATKITFSPFLGTFL